MYEEVASIDKAQMVRDKVQEIERENAILLSKMDKIASWSSERAARIDTGRRG